MNGLPYYKAYPRDFIEGTIRMRFELKGCYRLILDFIYMQGGNLPDDARYISGLLGCSIRLWKSLRQELLDLGKIQVSGEFLSNHRAVSQLETSAKLQDKNSESASRSSKNNSLGKANAQLTRDYTDTERKKEPLSPLREDKGAEPDFVKALFQNGVQFLIAHGNTEKAARSIIGKWRKGNADAQIYAAFAAAKKNDVVEPVAYITQVLNGDENERLKRWGIPIVDSRDFERSRNPGEQDPWDTKVDLSKVQPSTEICEPCDPLFERDVFIGRDSVAMPSLRA